MNLHVLGIDIAKSTFQLHGADSAGKEVLKKRQLNWPILIQFFKRLLRSHGSEPREIVTDKLRSYGVAHRELIPETIHSTKQYENNRSEQSHEATRVRERGMRRFKSMKQAQRFVTAHAAVSNLFNLGRHLVRAQHCRDLRVSAFTEWSRAVA